MTPRFTIGIPTHNRAHLLKRAIQAALDQTAEGVEILVSDNGSTDETPRVAREFGDRVRYLRSEVDLGAFANFQRILKEASGPYLSFLQDDDLLHRDWVRRALRAFSSRPDVKGYGAGLVMTPSVNSWLMPRIYSPFVAMDWMGGSLRYLDGKTLPALSFFGALALIPAVAFDTACLRKHLPIWHPDMVNLQECIMLAHSSLEGVVALEPWMGGIHFMHPGQASHYYAKVEMPPGNPGYKLMVDAIDQMLTRLGDSWVVPFTAILAEIAPDYRWDWANQLEANKEYPTVRRVLELLRQSLEGGPSPNVIRRNHWKEYCREITPPILWRTLKKFAA